MRVVPFSALHATPPSQQRVLRHCFSASMKASYAKPVHLSVDLLPECFLCYVVGETAISSVTTRLLDQSWSPEEGQTSFAHNILPPHPYKSQWQLLLGKYADTLCPSHSTSHDVCSTPQEDMVVHLGALAPSVLRLTGIHCTVSASVAQFSAIVIPVLLLT